MAGSSTRQPTAVLVLSAWHEGAPPRLVARITSTLDAGSSERASATASGSEEIAAFVRDWLEQLERRAAG